MHLKYTWWVVKQCSGVGSKLKVGGGARHQKSCQAKNKKDNGYGYV